MKYRQNENDRVASQNENNRVNSYESVPIYIRL